MYKRRMAKRGKRRREEEVVGDRRVEERVEYMYNRLPLDHCVMGTRGPAAGFGKRKDAVEDGVWTRTTLN